MCQFSIKFFNQLKIGTLKIDTLKKASPQRSEEAGSLTFLTRIQQPLNEQTCS